MVQVLGVQGIRALALDCFPLHKKSRAQGLNHGIWIKTASRRIAIVIGL